MKKSTFDLYLNTFKEWQRIQHIILHCNSFNFIIPPGVVETEEELRYKLQDALNDYIDERIEKYHH